MRSPAHRPHSASFRVLGIGTNLGYLRAVLGHASFMRGDVDTGFLDRETPALVAAMAEAPVPDGALAAAAAELLAGAEARDVGPAAVGESADPWDRRWPWIGE